MASGQRFNQAKTSIFFSRNTPVDIQEEILRLSGIPSTQRYDKYLGLRALVGKSRRQAFKSIKDKSLGAIRRLETKTFIASPLEGCNSGDPDVQYEYISSSEGIMLRNKCLDAEVLVG
jgi:hypothetical protein